MASDAWASPAAEPVHAIRRPLVVFSHPNHELAVFGLIQRLRPRLVFLTDGGSRARVEATRRGLARIGLLHRAVFLDREEDSLYRALLARDPRVFVELAREVAASIEPVAPRVLLCNAVEFFNPVHDMAWPVLRAATSGNGTPVYEIPLVYQRATQKETYRVQRVPDSLRLQTRVLLLTKVESVEKLSALREVYDRVIDRRGPAACEGTQGQFLREEVLPARLFPIVRPSDVGLRYEWRGERLRRRGAIDAVIRCREHWRGMVDMLMPTDARVRDATPLVRRAPRRASPGPARNAPASSSDSSPG